MKLSETVTLGDNNVSGVADSIEIATGRLGAASCCQIITSSTSDAVKKVNALFVIPKCRWLWVISSCKLKSLSHFLS